ncbi:GIY-YIG nuclease family protein [Candidatus Roizmanbacteria bacterium]|nr:GIY-YIG nuclease family protein [Candidatus Roizmanbacteria bacterium]
MFYYVYILLLQNGKFYTGSSHDLIQRIASHSAGKVISTKPYRPIKLVHYEAYLEKADALRREKYLKTTEGKYFLRQQIKVLFEKIKNKCPVV